MEVIQDIEVVIQQKKSHFVTGNLSWLFREGEKETSILMMYSLLTLATVFFGQH